MRDAIAQLESMGSAERSRRDRVRAENRARFPWFAELIDAIGSDAKLIWAQDAQGSIGKRPPLESHLFEVGAEAYDALRGHTAFHAKGRKRV